MLKMNVYFHFGYCWESIVLLPYLAVCSHSKSVTAFVIMENNPSFAREAVV